MRKRMKSLRLKMLGEGGTMENLPRVQLTDPLAEEMKEKAEEMTEIEEMTEDMTGIDEMTEDMIGIEEMTEAMIETEEMIVDMIGTEEMIEDMIEIGEMTEDMIGIDEMTEDMIRTGEMTGGMIDEMTGIEEMIVVTKVGAGEMIVEITGMVSTLAGKAVTETNARGLVVVGRKPLNHLR